MLARLQHNLPRLVGGGTAAAKRNYEDAIAIAPCNTVTRIYFAELLIELRELEQAREQLKAVLADPHDPQWAFEIKRDRRLAKELLETLTVTA